MKAPTTEPQSPFAIDILEDSAVGIAILDPELRVHWLNRALERYLSLDREELIGKSAQEIVAGTPYAIFEEPERIRSELLSAYATKSDAQSFECHVLADESRAERWFERSSHPITTGALAGGRVEYYTDISRARQSEADASEAIRELNRIMNSISDCLWSGDFHPDGSIQYLYFSPVIETVTGYPPSFFEAGPDRWATIVHPEDRSRMETCLAELLEGKRTHLAEEFRIVRPDGEVRWVRDSVRPTPRSGGVLRLDGIVTDINDRKAAEAERRVLEERTREAQRLESLGVLAGGVAHDFNNLLTGILGKMSLALRDIPSGTRAHANLVGAKTAAERAAELTHQMLSYSGSAQVSREVLNLSALVAEMGRLLGASISKHAKVNLDLAPDLPKMEADASQIRQVVMNLILNASESLGDESGTIRLTTRATAMARSDLDQLILGEGLAAGPYLMLEVSDTGCGMDYETRNRVFEPFFTTKFTGRGLGLATVLGTLRSHKGAIFLESKPRGGTLFRVWIPTCSREQETPEIQLASPRVRAASGLVLVVDDEEVVREFARYALEDMGMDVIEASNGREALELFRARARDISLVLLDLTMPGLGGRAVHRAMREVRPDLPIILSSGYGRNGLSATGEDDAIDAFLAKPYEPEQLGEAMTQMLGFGVTQPRSLP